MKVKIVRSENGSIPVKVVASDAGYDLYVSEDTYLMGGKQNRRIAPTGLRIALPDPCSRWWWRILGLFMPRWHYYATVKARSGMSAKGMVGCAEKPVYDKLGSLMNAMRRYDCDVAMGTVDAPYRGEVGIILVNRGVGFWIPKYTRIAQLIVGRAYEAEFVESDTLGETLRDGGFGHSGVK